MTEWLDIVTGVNPIGRTSLDKYIGSQVFDILSDMYLGRVAWAVIFLLICLIFIPAIHGEKDSGTVVEGDVVEYRLDEIMNEDDVINIDFRLVSGNATDVYILLLKENVARMLGDPFIAEVSKERVTSTTSFEWTYPDDYVYVLVIENRDNAHSNDATPDGPIEYTIEYEVNPEEKLPIWIFIICCVSSIIIPIILIIQLKKQGRLDSLPVEWM